MVSMLAVASLGLMGAQSASAPQDHTQAVPQPVLPDTKTVDVPAPKAGEQAAAPTLASAVPAETRNQGPAFVGSLAVGIAQVRELAEASEVVPARELADSLLAPRGVARRRLAWLSDGGPFVRGVLDGTQAWTEPLGWNGRPEAERARVRIERGLISLAPEERTEAERDFGRALALAPAGELRLAASYDLALLPLLTGEEWRALIPELGGPQPAPPTPAVPGAPPVEEEEAPDPLEEAKRAYTQARAGFIERLKLDWKDADTRANVELIQRRLRELDEIERQREEQEQEEQDKSDESEESEESEDQQDKEDGDEQEEQDPQDSEDPSEPDEPEDSEQPEDGDPWKKNNSRSRASKRRNPKRCTSAKRSFNDS